jgi:prepilin-type N-terminal cleavage/methylation domain-containing protein
MRNTLRKARSNKGFTLIELMIVVVIIGILAAIAIPKFGKASDRAKEKEADGIIKQVYTLQSAYKAQNGVPAGSVTDLETVGFEAPVAGSLKNYTFNTAVSTDPYCLTPTSGTHTARCINLTTGNIAVSAP